ncbi:hypothetical protein SAMN05216548_101163 [Faunimonas pinastri]|uniref:Uncharacterized protein n=1 Tax=Faunimonas pinastri TaxID=1855383 RepID=A0A1H8ZHY2_9HYPH|nr:zinc-binding alcohol dehydrogenase family protein [Faunimonas pinastri]SEP64139.1 hypothetical protein SAMN05216548_101163 [Faunimonas pinastri]
MRPIQHAHDIENGSVKLAQLLRADVVPSAQCIPLPDEMDDITAASIANPGMSSWAALTERAKLRTGEPVLVNGATGAADSLAVQIARHLGAAKIIATGRDPEALHSQGELGADVTIASTATRPHWKGRFASRSPGVSMSYSIISGKSAERLLVAGAKAGADAVPIRLVQFGSISGPKITLPGAVLRSFAIELMGSGSGSIPLPRMIKAMEGVLQARCRRACGSPPRPRRWRRSKRPGDGTTASAAPSSRCPAPESA